MLLLVVFVLTIGTFGCGRSETQVEAPAQVELLDSNTPAADANVTL